MKITFLQTKKETIERDIDSLESIEFLNLSLSEIVGKDSTEFAISLNDSSLKSEVWDGVTWGDLIDDKSPDSIEFGLEMKKMALRIEESAPQVFVLKTNGKDVLQFDFRQPDSILQGETDNNRNDICIMGNTYNIDYIIGGEFSQCTMRMRDFFEYIAKLIVGENWKEEYGKILEDYKVANTKEGKVPGWIMGVCANWKRDNNVEFSNFEIFADVKSDEINRISNNDNASKFISKRCQNICKYRNFSAHSISSLVSQGPSILESIITDMKVIAEILGNNDLANLLESKKKNIKETLFTERNKIINKKIKRS